MNKTKIQWVKNPDGTQGHTWNPITGCLNGCGYCYARKLANGRLRERYLANQNIAIPKNLLIKNEMYHDPFYPRFWPGRMPPHTYHKMDWKGVPIGIFVCDMGELFGDWIPHDWQAEIFDVILNNPWHRFYLLTKQPQNLVKFSPFPQNCWVGATATNQAMYDSAVYWLNQIDAKVKYISIEPLLSPIHLPNYCDVDWLIIGCQTKPLKVPEFDVVMDIVNVADRVGTPVFIKPPLSDIMNYHREKFPENGIDKL